MQFCAAQACGVLVPSGYCPAHRPRYHGPAAQAWRWYKSRRWQRLRQDILRRDPFCRTCRLEGRRTLTVDVDHIEKPQGDPGRFWDVANLQGLCVACHRRKTGRGQ